MRFVVFAAALLMLQGLAAAQVTPPARPPARDTAAKPEAGTARLNGRVVSGQTGKPLRRADVRVVLEGTRDSAYETATAADGTWEVTELPAGRYSLTVSKAGYVALAYGQRRPFEPGTPVDVRDGETIDRLDVSLPKAAAITGRVFDEFDEPVAGVRVAATRYRFARGERRLDMPPGRGSYDTSDDLGEFRLHGLAPGDYYVTATLSAGLSLDRVESPTAYAASFYSGTANPSEAQPVRLALGAEVHNVTFQLAAARAATVSGRATTAAGRPIASETVRLISGDAAFSAIRGMAVTRPDGSFTISNVPPGDYHAETQVDEPAEAAVLPLHVTGQDLSGVSLVTAAGATARGRVVFENGPPPGLRPTSVRLTTFSLGPVSFVGGGSVRVRDDWTFEGTGIFGTRVVRLATAPADWVLKSVRHAGADVTDSGLTFAAGAEVSVIEIVLTRGVAKITGTVRTTAGEPTSDYAVIAYSADAAKWGPFSRFVHAGRPDRSGAFEIPHLLPGEYFVVALEYLESGEELDPALLGRLKPQATRVTLEAGQPTAISLTLHAR